MIRFCFGLFPGRKTAKHFKSKDFTSIVFYGSESKIEIADLQNINSFIFYELNYHPCWFKSCRINEIINSMLMRIVDFRDEIIIESHSKYNALWGEILAKHLDATHLVYLLQEKLTLTRSTYDFLYYKYSKKALAGISDKTLPYIFKDKGNKIIGYSLPALCANVYEHIPCQDFLSLPISDFTIASIGRLNKPFVLPMLDDIIFFLKKYNDLTFNLVFIGGPKDGVDMANIKKKMEGLSNVSLLVTGYLFPIPIDFILKCDVFVSSAGSCWVSANCGVPTISIDALDFKAIGVIGYTTKNTLYRDMEPQIDVCDLLEEILINKKYSKTGQIKVIDIDFNSHFKFITEIVNDKLYYPVLYS